MRIHTCLSSFIRRVPAGVTAARSVRSRGGSTSISHDQMLDKEEVAAGLNRLIEADMRSIRAGSAPRELQDRPEP
jgi:hypothetical protein